MSITTWEKEFYPKESKKTTVAESVEHSIRKWEGLLQKNLKKHGLYRDGMDVFDEETGNYVFEASSKTCSLCHHFLNEKEFYEKCCLSCPLFKATGKICDVTKGNQWEQIVHKGKSPMIMINALKKARKFLPK